MLKWAASIHSEVNSISEWTADNNDLFLMWSLILSYAANIHSEVNSIAE
jgi:hypothetical protein